MNWLDRTIDLVAPRTALKRHRARLASSIILRHFEAAAVGRRTQGWHRATGTDANAAVGPGLARLREQARDLVRNNPWAVSALDTIVDHAVGWGITASPDKRSRSATQAAAIWKAWAETTACDAAGRLNLYGLQKLVMRTTAQDGEVLIRRRFRLPQDGLPLPLQLQVIEADYLDTAKQGTGTHGGVIVQGIEFDAIGRRTNYWLFTDHPGSESVGGRGTFGVTSVPVPATEIIHHYDPKRPGQVRGPSWYAPVILRMKDFDDYEDAALVKQKIAACLAVITSDVDGSSPGLGAVDPANPDVDMLEPGMIFNAAAGRSITVVDPPVVSEHAAYSATVLRAIAAGLGVTYEDMVGDYGTLPFSAARMSRLKHWARVEDWRWQMLIPQFCDPVWAWAMQAALILGKVSEVPAAVWTAPPAPMIDPAQEGLAYSRNIRNGIQTLPEAIKERGYDPDAVFAEIAATNKQLDSLGIILDSDARQTTQQGGPRVTQVARPESKPAPPQPASTNGNGSRTNGHHPDPLALLAQVRALAAEVADMVAERMSDRTPPDVSAPPAVPNSTSIEINVAADGRADADTMTTPVYDEHGRIIYTVKTRVKPDAVVVTA
jgi:lambda family phage portal protein